MTDTAEISILDKKIIRLLQGEFPLVAEPYKILAEKIGITEEELLARITAMREEKKFAKWARCSDTAKSASPRMPYASGTSPMHKWMRSRAAWRSIRASRIAMTATAAKIGGITSIL
ncbi:hypothetical protein HMPREF9162_1384 [Selenomonas sp. oral taxon 137 str. F0430]|nr:hypothetical protein HMPREF9162_1384 [Selenomonas sp. oral taxon 137 str. F0430]